MLLHLCCLLQFLVLILCGQECPSEYSVVGDKCYQLSSSEAIWEDARSSCNQKFGRLATIKNKNQNEQLYNWLLSVGYSWRRWYEGPYVGFYWDNDQFNWDSGETSNYTNWEYDDFEDGCIVITYYSTWYAYDCSYSLDYVCETDQISPPTMYPTLMPTMDETAIILTPEPTSVSLKENASCPDSFHVIMQSCYYFATIDTTWNGANSECQSLISNSEGFSKSWLVSIQDEHENDAIIEWLHGVGIGAGAGDAEHLSLSEEVYIGLRRYYIQNNSSFVTSHFQWMYDLLIGNDDKITYYNWHTNDVQGSDCVAMITSSGEWVTRDCETKLSFICQTSFRNLMLKESSASDTILGLSYLSFELLCAFSLIVVIFGVYFMVYKGYLFFSDERKASSQFGSDVDYDLVETTSSHFLVLPSNTDAVVSSNNYSKIDGRGANNNAEAVNVQRNFHRSVPIQIELNVRPAFSS